MYKKVMFKYRLGDSGLLKGWWCEDNAGNRTSLNNREFSKSMTVYYKNKKILRFEKGTTLVDFWVGVDNYFLAIIRKKKLENV
jgi:hypothetical protein